MSESGGLRIVSGSSPHPLRSGRSHLIQNRGPSSSPSLSRGHQQPDELGAPHLELSSSVQNIRMPTLSLSASGRESFVGSFKFGLRGISVSFRGNNSLFTPGSSKVDQLIPFLPQIVIEHLQSLGHQPLRPMSKKVYGSILFLDIKGYSKLADILADDTQNGAETLSHILNSFFSGLVDIVLSNGGDIIKFAGDAVICFFNAKSESEIPDTLRTSANCALKACEQLNNFPIDEEENVYLTMHASIGAGELTAFFVGGHEDKWEFFMTGEPFESIEYTGKLVHNSGDIYMTISNYELVKESVIVQHVPRLHVVRLTGMSTSEFHSPFIPAKAIDSIPEHSIRSCVVNPVLIAVDAAKIHWISEIRTVSVLFCSLSGISLKEESLELWQNCFLHMQQGIREFGGIIRQWLVDDKGATLVAAFGLPGAAHEDDVTRAVRSAMSIKTRINAIGMNCSLGVTTGKVYIGLVGNKQRCEYSMVGDIVNMAARLMIAAEDGILCDTTTQQSANITFEEVALLSLKGKRRKVPVFRPTGIKFKKKDQTDMLIGRDTEIALLTSVIEALDTEEGPVDVIIIEGPPGIGKTSIVNEAITIAESMKVEVITSEGDALQKDKIYHCWSKVFEQIFNLDETLDISSRKSIVDEFFDEYMPERKKLIPLLNIIFPLEYPENDTTTSMTAQCKASNTEDFLIEILSKYILNKRLLLVFEDVHNIDRSSWDLILALYRINYRFGLIMTTREMNTVYSHNVLVNQPSTQIIKIQGLNQNSMFTLITNYLGTNYVSKTVASYITSKAQGNPFFAEQLTDYLIDYNIISMSDGRVTVSDHIPDINEMPVPDSVERIVLSRLDSLTESQRHILKVGSIFGRVFAQNSLHYILKADGITEDLNELVECGILAVHTNSSAPTPSLPSMKLNRFSRKFSKISYGGNSSSLSEKLESPRSVHGKEQLFFDALTGSSKSRASSVESHNRPPSKRFSYVTLLMHKSNSAPVGAIYRFKNIVTRDVTYNSMTLAHRKDLHQVVAEWYEETYITDFNFVSPILAHHWSLAGRSDKAIEFLERSGQQALDCFSNHEAIGFFSKATELAKSDEVGDISVVQLAYWNVSIAEAYLGLGIIASASEHLKPALELLGEPHPSSNFVVKRRIFVESSRQFCRRFCCLCCRRSQHRGYTVRALLKRAHELNTTIYYYNHERKLCVYSALRALNLAEEQPEDTVSLAKCYANISLVTSYTPTTRSLASRYGSAALSIVEASPRTSFSGGFPQTIGVLMVMGTYHAGIGNMLIARETFLRAVEESKIMGDRRQWEEALSQLALVEYYNGDFESCLVCAERCAGSSSQRGDQQLHWRALSTAASCCLSLRRNDLATRYMGIDSDSKPSFRACSTVALLNLRLGKFDLAMENASTSLEKFSEAKRTRWFVLKSYEQTLEVFLACSIHYGANHSEYRGCLEKANRTFAEMQHFAMHYPFAQCRTLYYEGLVHLVHGRTRNAKKCLRKCISLSEESNKPYEKGLASLALADKAFHVSWWSRRRENPDIQRQLHNRRTAHTEFTIAVASPSSSSSQPDEESLPDPREYRPECRNAKELAETALEIFTKLHAGHDRLRAKKFLRFLTTGHVSVLEPVIGV